MTDLLELHCTRPMVGEELSLKEIEELRVQVPDWKVFELDGIMRLEREFRFKNFSQALGFSVQVGLLAEREDHHPAIKTEWGKATITFWTHKVSGLHQNDFICAARTDLIFSAG